MTKQLAPEEIEKRKQEKKQKEKEKKERQKEERRLNELKREEIRRKIAERREQEEKDQQTTDEPEIIEQNENILTGRYFEEFKDVFEKAQSKAKRYFAIDQEDEDNNNKQKDQKKKNTEQQTDGKQPDGQQEKTEQKLSRKKKKMMRWLKVAQLKAVVKRPDLVEAWDITAVDPLFLCELKTIKNTVPVPRHWNQKSKFLQTKRGILKPMFKLPEFIEATGISKLRDPFSERDGQKMVRQKLRERMNPRLGKIDIDYSVLHDAFFKYQTKSKLTTFGDTYYEGKEEEGKAKQFKPGVLSEELRQALGITDFQAPPWIINMQRYGAPPSYPTLRILGCNAAFSQLNSYTLLSKANLEEAAKKTGHAGLYATFKSYMDDDEENTVDKGYWGEVNEELQEQQEELEQEESQQLEQFGED